VHGVPNFPDPTSVRRGSSVLGHRYQYAIARVRVGPERVSEAVARRDPGLGSHSATRVKQGVKLAACMRAHGLRSFPDPTDSPPSTPPAPTRPSSRSDGVFTLTGAIVTTPAFKHARPGATYRASSGLRARLHDAGGAGRRLRPAQKRLIHSQLAPQTWSEVVFPSNCGIEWMLDLQSGPAIVRFSQRFGREQARESQAERLSK